MMLLILVFRQNLLLNFAVSFLPWPYSVHIYAAYTALLFPFQFSSGFKICSLPEPFPFVLYAEVFIDSDIKGRLKGRIQP